MIILEKTLEKSNPMKKLEISGADYENALSVSSNDDSLRKAARFLFCK